METETRDRTTRRAWWRPHLDINMTVAVLAFVVSGLSFYRSYIYTKQQLDLTVTEVSYVTNQGELYLTVAFTNSGTRDAALLRVEPILWSRHGKPTPEWMPITGRIANLPLTNPKMPMIVRAGGVEVIVVSAKLDASDAETPVVSAAAQGGTFLGLRVATMNSDGNLYLVEHPVARLRIDGQGHISDAEAAIHKSLSGFSDLVEAPPGDRSQANKRTPFVWADKHY